MPIFKYFILTIRHKYFVFIAGRKTKAPLWRLIVHDWSKFMPSELPHYGRQFFGKADDPAGWMRCWIHHQNTNPHHWEYWITRSSGRGFDAGDAAEMPEKYAKEMVADWLGASRAYEGRFPESLSEYSWYNSNFDKITLHQKTRKLVVQILTETLSSPIC